MRRGGLSSASSVTKGCSPSILRSMSEPELAVSFQLDELEALKTVKQLEQRSRLRRFSQ